MSEVEKQSEVITAFKGLDKNFQCRGYQYEVGNTYTHHGQVVACKSGFHACENPLDVLDYYPLDTDTRFAIVKASGQISRDGNKIASASIAVEAELKFPQFVVAAVDFIKAACNFESKPVDAASGYSSQLAASGNFSQLAASGNFSKLAASGYSSQLAASGNFSKLAASGNFSKLAASGDFSKLAASGNFSQLAASGDSSQLAASGNSSKLAASGNFSQLAASGDSSQLAASGYSSQLAASGDFSQLAASGNFSKLAASGEKSIAVAASPGCKAKAVEGGCIVLRWTDDTGRPRVCVGYIGENDIKAGVWYEVKNGVLSECADQEAP